MASKMKQTLAIKTLLHKTRLNPQLGFLGKGDKMAILRYHSIIDGQVNDYVSPNIALQANAFELQVKYLSKKYNVLSMDHVADCLYKQKRFPKKAVAITFDDGYRDNYLAYKILKKYGLSGTFYVVAGCIEQSEPLWLFEVIFLIRNTNKKVLRIEVQGQPNSFPLGLEKEKKLAIRKIVEAIKSNDLAYRENLRSQLRAQLSDVDSLEERANQIMLTWEQLREMSENGMVIGGHTMTHLNLPNANNSDAMREIKECKKLIEKMLDRPVLHFSYPNGGNYAYYNRKIMKIVGDAGYLTSTTSNNGLADLSESAYELRRIRVTPNLPEIYYQMEWEPFVDKWRKKLVKSLVGR